MPPNNVNKPKWTPNFDFASLYPTTMRDFSDSAKELARKKLLEERRKKIEKLNNIL